MDRYTTEHHDVRTCAMLAVEGYPSPIKGVKELLYEVIRCLELEEKDDGEYAIACGEMASRLVSLLDNFAY